MAKVMILGAISLAILFMAITVSSSRTISITVSEEVENQQSRRCQQQIQQAQQLRSCQQYLRQRSQSSEEEEADQSRGDIQRCCQQLQQIQDPQCRCEGLRQVVQQEQQRGELQGRERQQMLQTAQNLPGLCRVSPQRCEIQTRSWF
ncbi:2S seed storage albumin protein-like [Nicotiana tabacum]|uniref:2S seed storage albumin protein-like n=2 Tax=Nicotiana TaxID=4085 RepID=A0A1S4BWM1_TOBAC|nr:PREDICTED: 2S sulfur-rich seed storage protein 2-like [Nicotiana sylvestris]XP_016493301.1 PREDICTED: 2S sulfur-rich seed storage protein 2-like [Nicotiana tabacum]